MKKVIIMIALIASLANATDMWITTCDTDGRNCLTTKI